MAHLAVLLVLAFILGGAEASIRGAQVTIVGTALAWAEKAAHNPHNHHLHLYTLSQGVTAANASVLVAAQAAQASALGVVVLRVALHLIDLFAAAAVCSVPDNLLLGTLQAAATGYPHSHDKAHHRKCPYYGTFWELLMLNPSGRHEEPAPGISKGRSKASVTSAL